MRGLLLGQGLTWLALAASGLAAWILHRPTGLNLISDAGGVLWSGAELLGIAVAAWLGSAEVRMACRLAGGRPRALLTAVIGIQGVMLAAAVILSAFIITIGGSLLELLALGGLSARRSRWAGYRRAARAGPVISRPLARAAGR